jgi:hypothetical protein
LSASEPIFSGAASAAGGSGVLPSDACSKRTARADPSGTGATPLLTGIAMGESPRWHENRLWFSDWGAQEIIAVDCGGNSEVTVRTTYGKVSTTAENLTVPSGENLTDRRGDEPQFVGPS